MYQIGQRIINLLFSVGVIKSVDKSEVKGKETKSAAKATGGKKK